MRPRYSSNTGSTRGSSIEGFAHEDSFRVPAIGVRTEGESAGRRSMEFAAHRRRRDARQNWSIRPSWPTPKNHLRPRVREIKKSSDRMSHGGFRPERAVPPGAKKQKCERSPSTLCRRCRRREGTAQAIALGARDRHQHRPGWTLCRMRPRDARSRCRKAASPRRTAFPCVPCVAYSRAAKKSRNQVRAIQISR
jgi:hypothetical protein